MHYSHHTLAVLIHIMTTSLLVEVYELSHTMHSYSTPQTQLCCYHLLFRQLVFAFNNCKYFLFYYCTQFLINSVMHCSTQLH